MIRRKEIFFTILIGLFVGTLIILSANISFPKYSIDYKIEGKPFDYDDFQFADLTGDGKKELIVFGGPHPFNKKAALPAIVPTILDENYTFFSIGQVNAVELSKAYSLGIICS